MHFFITFLIVFANINFMTCLLESINAKSGVYFKYDIRKDDFFQLERKISFTASIEGFPELPGWLKLNQNSNEEDAVIYGTPGRTDVGTYNLEIVGWNKETYETFRHVMSFLVIDYSLASTKHQFEFKIKNKDINDMFQDGDDVLKIAQTLWPSVSYITLIEKPSHRVDGNNPLPGVKEGVYLVIGGALEVPANLKILKTTCNSIPSNNTVYLTMINAGYQIDWCDSKEINTVEKNQNGEFFMNSDQFYSTVMDTDDYSTVREHHISDLAYCFIAIILGFTFVVTLTCVMCIKDDETDLETNSSSDDRLVPNNPKYLPFNLDSTPNNDNKTNFSYGLLDESRSTTPNQVQFPETASRPPPYKMPPTRLPRSSAMKNEDVYSTPI